MKETIITALLALVSLSGYGQTTDTLSIGMEMKIQNVISTNVFMMHKETTPMKGLPADTASFHLYEMSGILCALGKTDKESTYFVSLDLNGDKDFTNDYRYSFTQQQVEDARNFTPQRYANICQICLSSQGGAVDSSLVFCAIDFVEDVSARKNLNLFSFSLA